MVDTNPVTARRGRTDTACGGRTPHQGEGGGAKKAQKLGTGVEGEEGGEGLKGRDGSRRGGGRRGGPWQFCKYDPV